MLRSMRLAIGDPSPAALLATLRGPKDHMNMRALQVMVYRPHNQEVGSN